MRATLVMAMLVSLFAVCLQAQQADNKSNMKTVQGCLKYNHRHYVLTESNGTEHQLAGSRGTLKPHVGHEVEVTGTEGVHTTGTTQEGAASSAHMAPTLQVSSIKHIADTCTAAGK